MNIIEETEIFLVKAGNGEDIDTSPPVIESYFGNDIDLDCFKIQLLLVRDMIKAVYQCQNCY